jgi:hypothetical protein
MRWAQQVPELINAGRKKERRGRKRKKRALITNMAIANCNCQKK